MSYSIAEAAERTGLSMDTLRYYERIGLIDPPARDSGGRRSYSEDDLGWVGFLSCLRMTGMPIRLMCEYARLRRFGTSSAGPRKQILLEQRTSVRERIAELQMCLSTLDYKIDNYEMIERRVAELTPLAQEATA
ncbi:MerR family transcriptional regulator [Allokutzneria multivorans]|uniref:MerR family transcriptional regulator n=1 Tax=Allokutzneria multivorans TaxID=1142134 RepID=A0ABP7R359_9PSEU